MSLAWTASTADAATGVAPGHGGLAFDGQCRLYRVRPHLGTVTRLLWAAPRPAGAPPRVEEVLFEAPPPIPMGDFTPALPATALDGPRGVAIDRDDRLFVGEAAGRRVRIFDLWSRRHLRTVPLPGAPADLATDGRIVWILLADGAVHRLTARGALVLVPWETMPAITTARALAVDPSGDLFVLARRAGAEEVIPVATPTAAFAVPGGTDLEFDGEGALVVARQPGQDFLTFRAQAGVIEERPPLKARGYDGAGVARAPDGRVVFFTADRGLRYARAARLRYEARGRVVTIQLDSGRYRNPWGRVFVDACVPPGTRVRLRCVALDEPEGERLPGADPVNLSSGAPPVPDPPPQLPVAHAPPPIDPLDGPAEALAALGGPGHPLVRRADGRELPWARFGPEDPFATYEAHALTPPGRFLWITLELSGDTRRTPRVRALRVESPGHGQLDRLPAVYRREPEQRDFLRRYLALFDGVLTELEARAVARVALVDPRSTPAELLPWLASFLGLTLDERWSEASRRQLIAEAAALYRTRGTLSSLRRFLEIALEHFEPVGPSPVILLEQFRLRGLGGAVVGDATPASTRAVLGGGFRIGGAIGVEGDAPLAGSAADAFATHAHRYTVLLQAQLTPDLRGVVEDLLRMHAPAHTIWEICAADSGMRVGRGLHVELSSLIGPTGGWSEALLGAWRLGRGTVVGRPEPGLRVGDHLGRGEGRVG